MSTINDKRDPGAPSEQSSAKRRRAAAQRVREARDRLTATTGTRPALAGITSDPYKFPVAVFNVISWPRTTIIPSKTKDKNKLLFIC